MDGGVAELNLNKYLFNIKILNEEEVTRMVQSILLTYFNISPNKFHWDKPLEILNEDFGILGILLDLEAILKKELNKPLSLLEHIDPTFNTPKDIVRIIIQ